MKASLSPERWNQIQAVFDEAADLAPEARAAWLDEACGSDTALRVEVESLLAAYADADAVLRDLDQMGPAPAASQGAVQVQTGRILAQYEVQERLGVGGMGEVYKASDTRLGRAVALKFLTPLLSHDNDAKARFIQEARAASALDHPNIGTIHEIGEADGQLFIAMALYEGQTLKEKIKQGPLPLDEALGYAVQIARGLAAAHGQGIIHRDIKPANVMVTDAGAAGARGLVKILDFGLAKMADVQLTRTGTMMGTVAYMSPEQTRGDTVDHRTDMWSLGVVLYEMLTGERPFKGTYEQAIIYSVLHEAPEPIADVNPDVPGDLEHVVTMCLEKEPSLRYPSMADLLADLEVFAQDTDEHLSTAIRTIMRQRRKAKRLVMAGLGMLAVLLVALTALLVWQTLQAGPPSHAGRQHIAVLPLTNNLGDTPENQALANGLMQQVTSTIARMETQQTAFWVVPAGEIVQKGIETASEARKIFGVDRVVTGSVQPVGAKTELILNLVDPEGMGILNTLSVTAELGQGFREAMQRVLADLLDAGLDTQVLQAISPTGSTSPNAYAFYLQGQGYLQRYDKPGNLDNAITLFEQALAEDSLYALAHAGLCEAAWEQYQATRDTLWISRALPSCDEAVRLDDQLASVHVTLGRFYYEGTSQYRKAEDELLRALELEPNNTDAYRWLGWVYHVQDQPIKAEEAHKQAVALKPDYWVTYSHLGTFYFYTGRLKEAGEQYQQIIRLTPDNYIGYNNLGIQRLDTGQEEEAERLLKRSIELKPNDLAYRNLGRLHYQRGAYAEAVQMYEQARALEANNEITWRLLGDAYYWAGDVARAQATWQRYVELAERILAAKPNDAELLGRLAATAVALGNAEQGRAYMGRLFALPTPDAYTFHFVGRTYAMLGEEDLALRYLARALEDGIPPVRIETDPWLEALRGTPGYQALRTQFLTST